MTIRAALFDACDVLYCRPRKGVALDAFLSRQGLSAPRPGDPTMAALKRRAMVGELSAEAFFESLLTHCGVRGPAALAEGLRVLAEAQADVEFFDGVGETLHRLKSAGLLLGVVTNTYVSVQAKLRWLAEIGIDRVWDAFAASSELKVAKPDPAIYRAALEIIDVPAADACFVGHAADELDGARATGLTTVSFNRDDETVSADHDIARFSDLLGVVGSRFAGDA
jgi:putative hydrolase of the HAD superfamily